MTGAIPRRFVLIALAMFCMYLHLDAHDVVVQQIVRMGVAPGVDSLVVRVEVPATLLTDAGLPTLANGSVDPSVDDTALQVVAADVARNLDFRSNDVPINVAKTTSRLTPDHKSVAIEITYGRIGSPMGLSARLNAFRGGPLQPPRTDVRYEPLGASSGAARLLSVSGPPVRVAFDPGFGDVFRRFATRALDGIFTGGSQLLFLICLLLPMRDARESARLFATLLAAEAFGILLSASVLAASAVLGPVEMIAWSIVVAAAIAAIAGASRRVLSGLTAAFGLLSGIVLGSMFNATSQLSGSHAAAALLIFMIVSLAAGVWLAAVMMATRLWLDRVLEHQMAAVVVAAAIVAHVAVHHVLDRADELSRTESFTTTHAVVLLILGWTLVMVIAAFVRLIRGAPAVTDRAKSGGAVL